ncbi:MAG: glycoside hydrolase family 20 zincin-like fold domain-containing protein [Bryobacteraceae bacterium]
MIASCGLSGQAISPLYIRGYTLIPEPQRLQLKDADFAIDETWSIAPGVNAGAAVETLERELAQRHQLKLPARGQGKTIEFSMRPGSVEIGRATDPDRAAVAAQAYRLRLSPSGIRIAANAPAGLFYGAETLVQLLKPERGRLWLPEGEIVDWPDVSYRELFWDQQQHLDRFEVLKQAVRRAAFFKANALALRLNEHFEYASAPALVHPNALSPAQLQELTDYGLRHHVQVVPYLDGPAHANFILNHDEYKHLRAFPEVAFEMCATNPETYRLLHGMMQNLIDANRGVNYFHLSTDEAWFAGKADNAQCREAQRAKELGGPSKVLAEFIQKTAGYLQSRGRKVIFWGEPPLQAEDVPMLPAGLINGEIYGTVYNEEFRKRGIRQMIYTNSLPNDPLFPAYYVLAPESQVHPRAAVERAARVFDEISFTAARKQTEIVGAEVYAWGDTGPHPETYWLGYALGAAAAWRPGSSDPRELTHRFYRLYYGRGASAMDRLYQLMSTQAQFYGSSWESVPSERSPLVFGYSYGIGPFTPRISTLPLPPSPAGDYLRLSRNWSQENARRLEMAAKFLGENDELLDLLYRNIGSVEFNRYNLEVYLSLAGVCRQNLLLFKRLDEIAKSLETAQEHAGRLRYREAVAALDAALAVADRIRDERNEALQRLTATYYKTWMPRVREGNGRRVARNPQNFVDMGPTEGARRRQEGMSYVMERQFALPFGDWVNELRAARNRYAAAHNLPPRQGGFDWQDTVTVRSSATDREL